MIIYLWITLEKLSPSINGVSDQDAQIPTIKYIYTKENISFKAENEINGLGINFALSLY
jgi:hypothetical protein